jgi:hypothetical protein
MTEINVIFNFNKSLSNFDKAKLTACLVETAEEELKDKAGMLSMCTGLVSSCGTQKVYFYSMAYRQKVTDNIQFFASDWPSLEIAQDFQKYMREEMELGEPSEKSTWVNPILN